MKSPQKILIVVGTRPNFIKITQFKRVAAEHFPGKFNIEIVHTGQHYDNKMANVFFEQFKLIPDYFLEIPAKSPNTQMAEVMLRLEKVVKDVNPKLLMVTGDVNSTFAAALTANKMHVPLAHIESGLRSFDRTMPEEINRLLTDEIADYLFVTEQSGMDNLKNEKKNPDQFFLVGNTMIDTMVAFEESIEGSSVLEDLELKSKEFALMTMHRPATVDHKDELIKMIELISKITAAYWLIFPIHPRTVRRLKEFGLYKKIKAFKQLILTEPLGYFDFQKLITHSKFILTDSGGIQEESTFRKVPCITLRPNTERPSTIEIGSNTLLPFSLEKIHQHIDKIETGTHKNGEIPPKWDGKATERILKIVNGL